MWPVWMQSSIDLGVNGTSRTGFGNLGFVPTRTLFPFSASSKASKVAPMHLLGTKHPGQCRPFPCWQVSKNQTGAAVVQKSVTRAIFGFLTFLIGEKSSFAGFERLQQSPPSYKASRIYPSGPPGLFGVLAPHLPIVSSFNRHADAEECRYRVRPGCAAAGL